MSLSGQQVQIYNKQMDAAIKQYDGSVDLIKTAIGKLSDIGVRELASWDGLQKLQVDVFQTVSAQITSENALRQTAETTDFVGQREQRTAKISAMTQIAKEMNDSYQKAMEGTLWAPQEYWDALQKGMMAVSAGRMVPKDVMAALMAPGGVRKISPDPNFMPDTIARFMGGDATRDNPFGSDLRYRPGARSPYPVAPTPDYATRPDLNPVKEMIGTTFELGLDQQAYPGTSITTPTARPAVGGGTPSLPLQFAGVAPEEPEDETGTSMEEPPGLDNFMTDFGPANDEEASFGFQPPDSGMMDLMRDYIVPPLEMGGVTPDLAPQVMTSFAAIYNGWDPEQVWGEIMEPAVGVAWNNHDENQWLQEQIAGIMGDDEDTGMDWLYS